MSILFFIIDCEPSLMKKGVRAVTTASSGQYQFDRDLFQDSMSYKARPEWSQHDLKTFLIEVYVLEDIQSLSC